MNIEQQENGKFKYREKYKHPLTNKWKSVTVTYEKHNRHIEKLARKELDRKIKKKLEKIKSCNNTDIVTFGQLADLYLESAKNYLKLDSTYISRYTAVKKLVRLIGEDAKLINLTSLYINSCMENDGNRKIIKILLKWAYTNELIERDLFRFIKEDVKKKKTLEDIMNNNTDEKEYYERDELKYIFDTLSNCKDFNSKILRLILEAQTLLGKRFGEVVALYDNDIDEFNQIVHIYKRSYAGSINTPKTERSIDDLGINRRVIQIKKEAQFLKRIHGIDSDFLFCNAKGKPFLLPTARLILNKHNINPKTHKFRKTCASLLSEQGVPLDYIQARLGHEDDKTTKEIYIQITSKMKQEEQDYFKNIDIL